MPYKIKPYSRIQANKLNVSIKPSTNKNKKIDVFKNNIKIASIGAIGYKDYPTFILEDGMKTANKRKKLYKHRHRKDVNNKNGNGFYANKILW